jgi:hypothetical protein
MLVSHSRDILVRMIQNAKGIPSVLTYSIPLYHDIPRGTPIIHIEQDKMILTFNLKSQQNQMAELASYTGVDNLYKGTSSLSCLPSSSVSGSGEVLS